MLECHFCAVLPSPPGSDAMNELQRQSYLSALGVESYAPRWLLPGAPKPIQCEMPALAETAQVVEPATEAERHEIPTPASSGKGPKALSEVMSEMAQPDRVPKAPQPIIARAARAAEPAVTPFTLSVWRSSLPILILDAREPRAAIPTERLLRNLLRCLGDLDPASVGEEVLACPLVPKPTVEDARGELSAWLEAELERRPVQKLILMGANAAQYLLPEGMDYSESLWHRVELEAFKRPALVAPSLIELLREPMHKRRLWQAVQALNGA
jgi:hypothetical protein